MAQNAGSVPGATEEGGGVHEKITVENRRFYQNFRRDDIKEAVWQKAMKWRKKAFISVRREVCTEISRLLTLKAILLQSVKCACAPLRRSIQPKADGRRGRWEERKRQEHIFIYISYAYEENDMDVGSYGNLRIDLRFM